MITFEEAKTIGLKACIAKLGREFVKSNKGRASAGYGKRKNAVFCFVGVDPEPSDKSQGLLLDHVKFPYRASCTVSLIDGMVEFVEHVVPEKK